MRMKGHFFWLFGVFGLAGCATPAVLKRSPGEPAIVGPLPDNPISQAIILPEAPRPDRDAQP